MNNSNNNYFERKQNVSKIGECSKYMAKRFKNRWNPTKCEQTNNNNNK